jgi:cytochrome P450
MTPTTDTIPVSDVDPFASDFLSDPFPFHEQLRELGPVVYLSRYDVHAIARYDDVHRALTDWQSLQSGAGVGLSNFIHEEPWRPPSLLLEADPPHHDAPRAVLEQVLSSRRLRSMEGAWKADAASLVEEVIAGGSEFDAVTALAEAFPLRVFPDAVGIGTEHREHLLPYGDFAFNAFGPRNERVTEPAKTIGPAIEWIATQCRRENLTKTGFGAQIWDASDRGEIRPEQAPLIVRSLLTAGVGPAPSKRRCGSNRPSRPFSARRRPKHTSRMPSSHPTAKCSCSSARRTATRAAGPTPHASTFPATLPATSDSAWESTSASGST